MMTSGSRRVVSEKVLEQRRAEKSREVHFEMVLQVRYADSLQTFRSKENHKKHSFSA